LSNSFEDDLDDLDEFEEVFSLKFVNFLGNQAKKIQTKQKLPNLKETVGIKNY